MVEQAGGAGSAHDATVAIEENAGPDDDKALAVAQKAEHAAEIKAAEAAVQKAKDQLAGAEQRLSDLKGAN